MGTGVVGLTYDNVGWSCLLMNGHVQFVFLPLSVRLPFLFLGLFLSLVFWLSRSLFTFTPASCPLSCLSLPTPSSCCWFVEILYIAVSVDVSG